LIGNFLRIVLIFLIMVCIFDPADKLLGLKVPLFVLAWILFIFDVLANYKKVKVSISMTTYLLLFMLIPLFSITYYTFIGGDFIYYDGFQYFKAYLFIMLLPILHVSKIDLIKPTVMIISSLSVAAVIILIGSYFDTSLIGMLNEIGQQYGILSMGVSRLWGTSVFPDLPAVYFHTAELIILPIGFFTMKVLFSRGAIRVLYGLLLAINMVAMFFSDTRNNIMACMLVPICIAYWYSRRKILILCSSVILFVVLFIGNLDVIKMGLSAHLTSNFHKISFLKDYLNLFADKKVLLFGQGLGSYFNTTLRGGVSLTELTYFEFVRSFGLILSLLLFVLFLYPLSRLRLEKYRATHYLFIVYLFFLIMSFFNPLLMSSSGMLLLLIVLYKTFSQPSPAEA